MSRGSGLNLPEWISPWCEANLGAAPCGELMQSAQMSSVFGLLLTDDRKIVVKARDDAEVRALSCVTAQLELADRGFPALVLSLLCSWKVPRLSMLRSGAQVERCCGVTRRKSPGCAQNCSPV